MRRRGEKSEIAHVREQKRQAVAARELEAMEKEKWQRIAVVLFRERNYFLATIDDTGRYAMQRQLQLALGNTEAEMVALEVDMQRATLKIP